MAGIIRRFAIEEQNSKKVHNSDKQRTDNPFENNSFFNRAMFAVQDFSDSAFFKNLVNKFMKWSFNASRIFSNYSLDLLTTELLMYYRLEQYLCYADTNEAKLYIQKNIDEYKNILLNKKNEPITVNGRELTYGEYILQLSDDQLEIFVQILHKKGTEKLTYGDMQKLSQTILAQKKQGGTAFLLDCENLPGDSSEVADYIEEIQKYINQKHEDLMLLDKVTCFEDLEHKKERMEKELSSFSEDLLNEIVSKAKSEMVYPPAEKNVQKQNEPTDIVVPVSATEYEVLTENGETIRTVYAGKTQTAAKTYYRSVSGHFYNQNGQEEQPYVLFNADKTVKAEITYTSEENEHKILKETEFKKDNTKTVASKTYYKYDVNGKFIWKYTEVSGGKYYYNQAGSPCKYEKEYKTNGVTFCDVYGYSDGRICDTPLATYRLVNNKRKKITKTEN